MTLAGLRYLFQKYLTKWYLRSLIYIKKLMPYAKFYFLCTDQYSIINSFVAGEIILHLWHQDCFTAGDIIFTIIRCLFRWSEHRDRAKATDVSNEEVNNVFLMSELTMSNLLPRSKTGMEFGSTGIISTFVVSMAPSVSLVTLVLEAILRKSCFQAPASSIFALSVMSTTTRNR